MLGGRPARTRDWGPWNTEGLGGTGRKGGAPGHPEVLGVGVWDWAGERARHQVVRGKLNVCVARSGGVVLPLGLPACPTPNSKPGTYLMAFFSLRPRPESGVPTVSKEFL